MNKLIGREVLFLHTTKDTPRNGEGSFIRLNDGRIMFSYTRFSGGEWEDDDPASLATIYSSDDGENWSEPEIILSPDVEAKNLMCPSLIRMNNGDLGLVFLKKMKDGINAVPWFTRSSDNGKSFSEPQRILPDYTNYK